MEQLGIGKVSLSFLKPEFLAHIQYNQYISTIFIQDTTHMLDSSGVFAWQHKREDKERSTRLLRRKAMITDPTLLFGAQVLKIKYWKWMTL